MDKKNENLKSKSSEFEGIYETKLEDIWKHESVYEKEVEEFIEKTRIEELENAKNVRNSWIL